MYQREGDRITLSISVDQWLYLLRILSFGVMSRKKGSDFWEGLKFLNALNEGNPNYRPYQIPEEFR